MIPIRYNARNLMVRWKTTLLTASGFTMVVALLVVMLSFVEGMSKLAEQTGPVGNVIILRDGATDEVFSDILIDANISQLWNNHPEIVRDGDRPRVSQEVNCVMFYEFTPDQRKPGQASYTFLQIRGVEDPAMGGLVHGLPLARGKWFDRTGNQVVMGDGIARNLGLDVGDSFHPRPELDWKVVGIMDTRGSPFDSEIWAKREDVGRYFGKDNEETKQSFFTSIVVTTPDRPTAEQFASVLQDRVKQVRINALPEREYYEKMDQMNQVILSSAIFIAAIMSLGGMFGLMNTMFATVSQRVKDIGVLRILGYQRSQILWSFFLESMLIAIVGGALGLALGLLAHGVEQGGLMSSGPGSIKIVVFSMMVTPFVIISAVVFTLVMGFLGGFFPALSAMRLKVLDAVR